MIQPLAHSTPSETVAFGELPPDIRHRASRRLDAFKEIEKSKNKLAACKEWAPVLGCKWKTLKNQYHKWLDAGRDPIIAVDKRKSSVGKSVGLSKGDIATWHSYALKHQRSSREAHRKLMADIRSGVVTVDAPMNPRTGEPHGMSYTMLMKAPYKPDTFTLTNERQGTVASKKHRPRSHRSRVGCQIGQFYFFDDMWHDFYVAVPGQLKASRPLAFHCIDYLSAKFTDYGFKPRMEDPESGKNKTLNEADFRFFVAQMLMQPRINPELGSILGCEHGMAAIREDLARDIYDLSGGLIDIDYSGLDGKPAHAGQWRGPGGGRPEFKASLESAHNLVHNIFSDLPGQTGKDRDHQPEETTGMLKYHEQLMLAELGNQSLAGKFEYPFVTWQQFLRIADIRYQENLNGRTEHKLEGWDKLGFKTLAWRMSEAHQQWSGAEEWAAMTPEQQELTRQIIASNTNLYRERRLSPTEVYQHGNGYLQRAPLAVIAAIMVRDPKLHSNRNEKKIRNNEWTLEWNELGDDPVRYWSEVTRPDGSKELLPDGYKANITVNPGAPHLLWVYDAKERFIGVCQQQDVTSRADQAAGFKQLAKVGEMEKRLLAPSVANGRQKAKHIREMRKANAEAAKDPKNVSKLPKQRDLDTANTFEPDEPDSMQNTAEEFTNIFGNNSGETTTHHDCSEEL